MRIAISAILIGLAAAGHAADADAKSKAADLLAAMKTGELVTQTMEVGFVQGVKPFMDQAPPEQRAGLQQGVDAAAAYLREQASWESMRSDYVDLYASAFTPAELDQLLAFYQSPIGQRLVERTPKLTEAGMELGAQRMRQLMPEVQRIMMDAIAKAQNAESEAKFAQAGLVIGKPFPEMTLTTTDGGTISTRELVGKVVLIDYWATWCAPCVRELPNVLETYQRFHPQGFEVVGISLDEDVARLQQFVAERQVPWKQVCDGRGWQSAYAQRFGIDSIPATFLIAKDGTLAAIGLRGEELGTAVEKALKP